MNDRETGLYVLVLFSALTLAGIIASTITNIEKAKIESAERMEILRTTGKLEVEP